MRVGVGSSAAVVSCLGGDGGRTPPKWLQFSFEMATNFATIGPRSCRDGATIVVVIIRRSPFSRLEKILLRKLPDHGSIAPRSWLDRTAIVEFFHESSGPSDEDRYLMKI